jgi:hypothetical protein
MDAACLNSGMSKDDVCVESMVLPFGRQTLRGSIDLTLLWKGALINKKCPVQADSTIDVS